MQFIGILNSAVVLKNMYYNEPNEELQLVYYNQVLSLESKGIQHDFALLKLQTSFERAQYFQLFPSLEDKIKLAVTGYANFYGNQFRLLTHSNDFNSISDGGIFYDIDTETGLTH